MHEALASSSPSADEPAEAHHLQHRHERLWVRASQRPARAHRGGAGQRPLHPQDLLADLQRSLNATEMARRKFRDIASIAGPRVQRACPAGRSRRSTCAPTAACSSTCSATTNRTTCCSRQAYDRPSTPSWNCLLPARGPGTHPAPAHRAQDPGRFHPSPSHHRGPPARVLTSEQLEDRIGKMTGRVAGMNTFVDCRYSSHDVSADAPRTTDLRAILLNQLFRFTLAGTCTWPFFLNDRASRRGTGTKVRF